MLAIRICSPQKDFTGHSLYTIYTAPMLQAFFRKMKELNIPYGVFSRKNGIQVEGNDHHAYLSIEEISDHELRSLLKSQWDQYQHTTFFYWNHRPLTHTKYVTMLREVGFFVIEFRTLSQFSTFAGDFMNLKKRFERLSLFVWDQREFVAAQLQITPFDQTQIITEKYGIKIHNVEYNFAVIEDIERKYYDHTESKMVQPTKSNHKSLDQWVKKPLKDQVI